MENEEYSDLTFDRDKKFQLLLELAVETLSKVHGIVLLSYADHYGGDGTKLEAYQALFEKIANEVRSTIIDSLFEKYGWLPPDILER